MMTMEKEMMMMMMMMMNQINKKDSHIRLWEFFYELLRGIHLASSPGLPVWKARDKYSSHLYL